MINIKDNILKELDFSKKSSSSKFTGTVKSSKDNSFNNVLDKTIGKGNMKNSKDNDVNKVINEDEKLCEESDEEVTRKNKDKKVMDILQIILATINSNGDLDVDEENVSTLKEHDIEELSKISDISKETLKEVISEIVEKYISDPRVHEENISVQFQSLKETVYDVLEKYVSDLGVHEKNIGAQSVQSESLKETAYDVLEKYISDPGVPKENINNVSNRTLERFKEVITEMVKKNDITQVAQVVNKSEVVNNIKVHEKNPSTVLGMSKESNFLENLVKDDSDSENISMDKINFHLNKIQNLNKIGNEVNSNNINKTQFVNRETIDFDVVKSIKLMSFNNMKELTLKVVPRELGELIIKVSMDNGVLKANITSNTKEAYELLQNNSKSILEKLQGESIRIEEFSVDIYDQNNTSSNKENFKDRRGEYEGDSSKNFDLINSIDEEEEELQNGSLDDVINMLA